MGARQERSHRCHQAGAAVARRQLPDGLCLSQGYAETRDLLRRRTYLVRKRAELFTHLQILNAQYNLAPFPKRLCHATNRADMKITDRFSDASVQKSAAANLAVIDRLDEVIDDLERHLTRTAKIDSVQTYHRLQSIPGVGKLLALMLLYEMCMRRSASTAPVSFCPTRGWCAACTNRQARSWGRGARRSAMPICAGRSRRRPACSCSTANAPRNGSRSRRRSAAAARPWRSWRRGWRGRCTTCCARRGLRRGTLLVGGTAGSTRPATTGSSSLSRKEVQHASA